MQDGAELQLHHQASVFLILDQHHRPTTRECDWWVVHGITAQVYLPSTAVLCFVVVLVDVVQHRHLINVDIAQAPHKVLSDLQTCGKGQNSTEISKHIYVK